MCSYSKADICCINDEDMHGFDNMDCALSVNDSAMAQVEKQQLAVFTPEGSSLNVTLLGIPTFSPIRARPLFKINQERM